MSEDPVEAGQKIGTITAWILSLCAVALFRTPVAMIVVLLLVSASGVVWAFLHGYRIRQNDRPDVVVFKQEPLQRLEDRRPR